MSTVQAIFAIIGTTVGVLGAFATLMWWAFKRGQATGEAQAKIEALSQQLAETRAELAAMQPKRRRT